VLSGRSILRRTDLLLRGVLPTVARRVCDLENLVNEEAIARVGLQRHLGKKKKEKKNTMISRYLVCAVHTSSDQQSNADFFFFTFDINVSKSV
jgi:hypothetical protein